MINGEIQIAIPKGLSVRELEFKINEAWAATQKDLVTISKNHGADLSNLSPEQKRSIDGKSVDVSPVGGGIDPITIALLISMTPLIKALTPILEPAVKSASAVAEKIALDVWEHIKSKLWQDEHIALVEKK